MIADTHGAFLGLSILFMLLFILVGLAVFVLSVVVTVTAYKEGRQGWWVYLIAIFVFPLVSVVAWYAYLRKNPVRDSKGRPFL